ncbi:hypothetical protein [Algoriphagus sp. Y33]|uniref:hypothetical protein n=1 Tax=Algoriphagus sp. Y33 TaxID=2772483 RepID=UPI00177D5B92|nr:hypothetical protein [Algoriphagus sp. Y33]
MGTRKTERIILIDADVLSHFITGGQILLLPSIYPYPIKVLDKVYAEISRMPGKKTEVDNLLKFKLIEQIPFPEDQPEIKKEYLHIKKLMFKGDGESACLAVVRYSENILASSNLKDIASYCKMHHITYLTTMDFLCQAVKKGQLTESDCDDFIQRVLKAGSRLPVKKWGEYECREVEV